MPRIMKMTFGVLLFLLSFFGLIINITLPAYIPVSFVVYFSIVFCAGIIAGIWVCYCVINDKTL